MMKWFIFLVSVIAFTPAVFSSDIRIINQRRIDLEPIHEWQAAKARRESDTNAPSIGERPLKHWKDIAVTEYVKTAGGHVVVARLEGGATQTIMLRNCPPSLLAKLTRRKALVNELSGASDASRAAAAVAVEKVGKTSSAYSVSGSAAYVNAVVTEEQRRQDEAAAAMAKAKRTQEQVEAMKEELEKLNSQIEVEGRLLAISLATTYSGYPVWDTGIASR